MNDINFLENCRFCLKEFKDNEKFNKLTKTFQNQYFNLTQLEVDF